MRMRSLLALSTSLALISCNFVPESFNKSDDKLDTLALLKKGDKTVCAADDVLETVKSVLKVDPNLLQPELRPAYAIDSMYMEKYDPAMQSAECKGNITISVEGTQLESKPLHLTYKIYPSSENAVEYVVSVEQAEELKKVAGELLQLSLLDSTLHRPEPQDDTVPENSFDAASYNSADAAAPTPQEEADLDQNASDAAAIDVNR